MSPDGERLAPPAASRHDDQPLPDAATNAGDRTRDPTCGGGRLILAQPGIAADRTLGEILRAAGWHTGLSQPRLEQSSPPIRSEHSHGAPLHFGVWGRRAWSVPGRTAARLLGRRVLTLEDGPLRSIQPPGARLEAARSGPVPPLSLMLDDRGIAIDAEHPSRLEALIAALAAEPLPPDLARRAKTGLATLRSLGFSKYTPYGRGTLSLPEPGYVLVLDQTRGDASIALGSANASAFRRMLEAARTENPDAPIVIKTHPETANGRRAGHFAPADLETGEALITLPINPWDLIEGASKVYAVTSQLGYEAVLAGKETHLFGLPYYAGWGLTHDRQSTPRIARARAARPCKQTLFAATHLLGPLYWNPYERCLTSFEDTLRTLEALAKVEQGDVAAGRPLARAVYGGFAPWKRQHLSRFSAPYTDGAQHFRSTPKAMAKARRDGTGETRAWLWASRANPGIVETARAEATPIGLVEDGFLRSVGLGAALTDAASLVFDDLGIHYDPARRSRLEAFIAEAATFAADDERLVRAAALCDAIRASGVTKYNLDCLGAAGDPAAGAGVRSADAMLTTIPSHAKVVLVPGQVEDDASVRLGAAYGPARSNLELLRAARAANPHAFLIYKPHPDVEAGLRVGRIPLDEAEALADLVAHRASAPALLERADAVWTLTSLMGFEALIRGVSVTCVGTPFYAGWGLTADLGIVPMRRQARPSLTALIWAALIAYPRYVDPETRLPAPPEVILVRLAKGRPSGGGGRLRRMMAASQAALGARNLVRWR
ncbi:MAG: capsular polysaccharide biosynthesis protein [Pseudomonadota bacterium]